MTFNLETVENARNVVTASTIGLLVVCFVLLVVFAFAFPDTEQTIVLAPTPAPTPSPTPDLITVEYVIEFVGDSNLSSVEFWYTSDVQGINSSATVSLRNNVPYTMTLQLRENTSLEISAILSTEQEGELTCRIYEDGSLIVQNTNAAKRPGVYCRGTITK